MPAIEPSYPSLSLEDEYLQRHLGQLQQFPGDSDSSASEGTKRLQRNLHTSSNIRVDLREREPEPAYEPSETELDHSLLAAATEAREIREFREFITRKPRDFRLFASRRFFSAWTPFAPSDTHHAPGPPERTQRTQPRARRPQSGVSRSASLSEKPNEWSVVGRWPEPHNLTGEVELTDDETGRQSTDRSYDDQSSTHSEDTRADDSRIDLGHRDRISTIPSDLLSLLAYQDESSMDFVLSLLSLLRGVESEADRNQILAFVEKSAGEVDPMLSIATESGAACFTHNMFVSPTKDGMGTVQQRPRGDETRSEPPTPMIAQSPQRRGGAVATSPRIPQKPHPVSPAPQQEDSDLEFDTADTETADDSSSELVSDSPSYVPTEFDSPEGSDASSAERSIEAAIASARSGKKDDDVVIDSTKSGDLVLDRSYDYSEPADSMSNQTVETGFDSDSAVSHDTELERTVDEAISTIISRISEELPVIMGRKNKFTDESADRLITMIFDRDSDPADLISHVTASLQRHINSTPLNKGALVDDVRDAFETYGKVLTSYQYVTDDDFEVLDLDDLDDIVEQRYGIEELEREVRDL
ncbi:hypothetical protein J8273_8854 [Carpediemonas membranifera]|uniref:Uncharacterized protein n=1 Tax=Carpediemonas membranifera TaxID=201153 RepID=A0A8J6DYT9_9EUKA|nr:hypothetical protein J8273_8854 [Carpediemonas membranifera]|eukprot:KAG9389561.1 hypothetical protein J8273_8854 [Carpediemonas membranifera]